VRVGEQELAYVDVGTGDPIVRQPDVVLPVAQRHPARAAPGPLPGTGPDRHGGVSKLPDPQRGTYSFVRHAGFLQAVDVTGRVTIVGHDGGGALAASGCSSLSGVGSSG
jgi:haloalkane dehalogenase